MATAAVVPKDYKIDLFAKSVCRVYNYKGHDYYTHIDFTPLNLKKDYDTASLYSRISDGMIKSLDELLSTSVPDGKYTWLFFDGIFYCREIKSKLEVFGKHEQLLTIMRLDYPDSFKDYKSHEDFIDEILPVDTFFSGELEKIDNTIKINFYSGTFMEATLERAAKQFHIGTSDVDKKRYDILESKIGENIRGRGFILEYVSEPILDSISGEITSDEMKEIRDKGGEPYLFVDKKDCLNHGNYEMNLLSWQNKRQQAINFKKSMYRLGKKSEMPDEELNKEMYEWDIANPKPQPITEVPYTVTEKTPLTKGYYLRLRYNIRGRRSRYTKKYRKTNKRSSNRRTKHNNRRK